MNLREILPTTWVKTPSSPMSALCQKRTFINVLVAGAASSWSVRTIIRTLNRLVDLPHIDGCKHPADFLLLVEKPR